ncbi:HNH endonuclease [Algoriphagus sp. PAP.12]|uniref:HNH endonuclease n=1 Tax=Algoriphagus sp. PAP.12 TaxID=2996678 RepID=UPI00227CB4FA|nr:HNH endonuclease [Algoriphagus sp. PAP.12]
MIKIERSNLSVIADDYLKQLQKKRFNKKRGNVIQNYWVKNREKIIKSEAKDFDSIIDEFKALNQDGFDDFKDYMKGQYEDFFYNQKIGKWLAEQLNVKTCPYCNRQYIFTIQKGTKNVRPEFDHFYPKSTYPYLALSLYNLIPACPTCNHTKSKDPIDKNPYIEGFQDNYRFELRTKDGRNNSLDWALENEIEINFTATNENVNVFALKELYNEHLDYVNEIIDKTQAYNHSYYNSLIESYKGLGKQEADIDRFIWGNYLENAEHEKRPLSKLTKDILEQLKIK